MKVLQETVRETAENSLDGLERYRPFVIRHRWTLIFIGSAAVTALGTVVVIARTRRRRQLKVRLQHALPDLVNERLVRPLTNLREGLSR